MKIQVRTLAYLLILIVIGLGGAMLVQTRVSAVGESGDTRRTEIVASVTEYQWWLTRWNTNGIACVVGIEREGLPTNLDILADCGESVYKEWIETAPCPQAAESGNVSACKGMYLFLAGQQTVEKNLVIDLPQPSVWLTLRGCSPQPPLSLCEKLPNLVLTGEEPLPNEVILSVFVKTGGEVIECTGSQCELPLKVTFVDGQEIEFWAVSSFGDESEHFTARIRVVDTGVPATPGAGNWFVDIISSQWRGDTVSSCAAMWEAFPPLGGQPQWLTTPPDHHGLASNTPFVFLAGELIRVGIVDTSACLDQGLLTNGAASPCGVEAARTIINDWQDQFDAQIFATAQEKHIPAQLLKNLFAQESQFWPGQTVEKEFGFGQLTDLGADTTLLWNTAFYDQFCPLVLHEETCGKGYAFLGAENQELLRGALAAQSGADCSTCAAGVDLSHAHSTIDLFGETVVANCAQVAFLVSDITGQMPGVVSSYDDLWRFTLASYNAGPYCLARALNAAWRQTLLLDWPTVSSRLSVGCAGAIEYVDRVTRDRLPADADFLPTPAPTSTLALPPPPGITATPVPPSGYPPPTSDPGGYPPPQTTATPGYP